MISLYVIDDHPIILDGLRRSLGGHFVVNGSDSLEKALSSEEIVSADIIILDLYLNNDDPVCNHKKLQMAFPEKPVVIFTGEESVLMQMKMYKSCVKAYMVKSIKLDLMIKTLQEVFNGTYKPPPEISQSILFSTDIKPQEKVPGILKILTRLTDGSNIKEIARDMKQSESSIEKKIKRQRMICNLKSNYQLIYYFFRRSTM